MYNSILVLAEYHPAYAEQLKQTVHQTITIWLTKELHK